VIAFHGGSVLLLNRRLCVLGLLASLVVTTGCHHHIDYSHELPAGMMALRKISPGEYPKFSFAQDDMRALHDSTVNSLAYLAKKSSQQYWPYLDISHDRAVASCNAFLELVDEQTHGNSPTSLNQAIRDRFEVYQSIGGFDESGKNFTNTVLFTGYFTPIYDGSLTPTGEYKWPLYKRPEDLISDPEGVSASRRTPEGQYVLYYTRQELENSDKLKGKELVYLKTRWEAYVITVQGSAKIRLPDGSIKEVGYAGNNGYPYTSPGRQMLADKVISKDELTLKGLKKYFEDHPADMDKYLALNQRFVFFTDRPGGPFGSLNVPVTTFATIATDKSVYPRAMPSFLSTAIPADASGTPMKYDGFMLEQDTGGAIRAAGRCDIYMGVGPQAEAVAGHQLHEGKLYYLAVKPELIEKYMKRQSVAMAP
jgi:membrane-bound lytic murein transglycosylase A